MTETPSERAERVERLYEKCARRGGGSMADVTTLRNDVRAMYAAWNQLRHTIDAQAHRIQSGLDRIAELETERDNDLCVMVAFLKPNARGEAAWTAILANHFGPRAQEFVEDTARFAAAYSRVNQLPPVATEPDDTAGSAT